MKQTFNQVVNNIRNAEKNVDKVLDAARLKRIESGKMSDDRFNKILDLVKCILFGCAVLAVAAMYIAPFVLLSR